MTYNYSTPSIENSAKAVGTSLPISRKQSVNICKKLRGMNLTKAKKFLEQVIVFKKPVPFPVYPQGAGHKPGMRSGRYPISACTHILKLIKSAEANAQYKGLATGNLSIQHMVAQKGPTVSRFGRQRVRAKRSHIEIVLQENKEAKK